MRVLLDVSAVPARPVGAGVYTIELAARLARGDDDLHLLARRGDAERWAAVAPGAAVHAAVPAARPARLAWEQARGAAVARDVAPDVWHGPHYTLPLRADVPMAVTVHDMTFFDHPEWHERSKVLFFRRMIGRSVRRARVVLADSAATEGRIRARLAPRAPIVVAPLGVDLDRFRPDPSDGAEKEVAGLRAFGVRPPYIAFAGLLEPRKAVPVLVDAFARLAPTRPDLTLVIAGRDGWGTRAVWSAVQASGAATRILRPGWIPDDVLPALYRQAAAVVYPSLEEGFGLPVLEALACGAPVVTSRGSATEEVAGDAALLTPPGDAPALAHALVTVLDRAEPAASLRTGGPARAREFTWDRTVAATRRAYRIAKEG